MAVYAESLTKILKQYLNHIVYIDDEFKVSWETEEKEELPPPRRSRRASKDVEEAQQSEEVTAPKSNLENFCRVVRKEYPEILLTPLVYEDSIDEKNLIMHMKNARMLILDWSLSERVTAVHLLENAEFSGQLRFCVIYTSRLESAKREFVEKISNVKEEGFHHSQYKERDYDYIRVNSVIYMLCEKDKFDFHMIMDSLVDIFIKEIGYFPIAFIDMIVRVEQKVPYYLNEFSYPFDKLLFLQTSSDGLPIYDVYHTISDMVINNIRTDIDLDENVLNGIYDNQIDTLNKILQEKETFEDRLNRSLEEILKRLGCKDEDKEIIKSIPVEKYKKIMEKAIKEPKDLSKGIQKASEEFAKAYGTEKAERVIAESNIEDNGKRKVKKELIRLYARQIQEKVEKIFPACLMVISNPEESYNVNRLVTSLKVVNYKSEEKTFSDIFENCYDENEEYMCIKTDSNGPKLGLLQNKLNPGDVLYKRRKDTGELEGCYLCIVPSCHLLRPKKVEGNIVFVEGKIVKEKPDGKLRDSEHFAILPGVDDENQLVRVIWQYHKIAAIDFHKISKDDFKRLYRPYKLAYEYVRQIMGEFVAFYSKSGVEELFLKADTSLGHLLLQR